MASNNESIEKSQIITIKFNNLKDHKSRIIINLQEIEYDSDETFKFGYKYYLNEKTENDQLKIKIPTGKYVGSIQLISSKTTPFLNSYTGYNTIYFGVNENHEKIIFKRPKCFPKSSYSYRFINTLLNSTFCNDLDMINSGYTVQFSANSDTSFNESRTLWLTYLGISSGFAKAFAYYPYAPILFMTGYFGFLHNDIYIRSEISK
ncbi:hypothetical protein EHQ79_06225 [Leptospira jelokensis]|nr:hypothetical protein EHQ79_06225 [Leptospira jelokensis]